MASEKFYGTGRRKSSVARVYLSQGTGKITINKRDIDEFFGPETLKMIVRQPLAATDTADKFDVTVTVRGGGYTGQAGAIRHGISRALCKVDSDAYRKTLKAEGFLTRDPRRDNRGQEIIEKARKYAISGLFLYPNPFDSFSRILKKNRSDLVVNTGATTP